jgi:hypothetical protein
MGWTDRVKDHASSVRDGRATSERRIFDQSNSAGWDPYEVWLTRIKQPRELSPNTAAQETM